jgi:radical SAM protein with 4Fe4S-binding SPASM domain
MVFNRNEVVSVSRIAKALGVAHRINYQLSPTLSGSLHPYQHRIGFKEFDKIHRECYPQMHGLSKSKTHKENSDSFSGRNTAKIFNCSAGETSLTISPFGELKLCLEIDYPKYDILKGSLKQGWRILKNIVDRENKKPLTKCKACNLIQYCSWCPAKSWLENRNFSPCPGSWRKDMEEIKESQCKE